MYLWIIQSEFSFSQSSHLSSSFGWLIDPWKSGLCPSYCCFQWGITITVGFTSFVELMSKTPNLNNLRRHDSPSVPKNTWMALDDDQIPNGPKIQKGDWVRWSWVFFLFPSRDLALRNTKLIFDFDHKIVIGKWQEILIFGGRIVLNSNLRDGLMRRVN